MNIISNIFILKLIKKIKSLNNIKGIKTKLENIILDLKIVLISTGKLLSKFILDPSIEILDEVIDVVKPPNKTIP